MSKCIGLFGGSFNPIHHGHLIVARSVAEQLDLDRVIFLPSATPPHKNSAQLVEARHRQAMVTLAIAGEPTFDHDDYDLRRAAPSYTVETVVHFQESLGAGVRLIWIIGADSLAELATWHQVERLVALCRVVTAARPGWERPALAVLRAVLSEEQIRHLHADVLPTPGIDISATQIRQRIAAGRSVRYLVPAAVDEYIRTHGLYR